MKPTGARDSRHRAIGVRVAPVDRPSAVLMALPLIIAVPISFALAAQYVTARMWLLGGDLSAAFSVEQRTAYALTALRVHEQGVMAVELFWGLCGIAPISWTPG